MYFPNRSTHDTLIAQQLLNEEDRKALLALSDLVESVVESPLFESLVKEGKWNTVYGHCAVASCAMQVLAWVLLGIYLDTYFVVLDEDHYSHWFLQDPQQSLLIDPTRFQFEEGRKLPYAKGERTGHPSRRKSGPHYTSSPPVIYIINAVTSMLDVEYLFQSRSNHF